MSPGERFRNQQWVDKVQQLESLIQRIQSALGTEEEGDALVEVARNAHKAEREYAGSSSDYDHED